jgi:tetrapyrrole methylase family protein/MazG family protein
LDFQEKETYTIEDLLKIVRILRSPGGCPWDREQTHQSIRACLIEETYEAVEAIDTEDTELLKEELGDVLLQVVFHADLEQEAGRFHFDQVADGICKKLIVRHPHVFGDVHVQNTAEVLKNWDAIKKRTKHQSTQAQVLESVSPALPALMRSAKVQQKAAKSGYDFADVWQALEKAEEEIAELKEAILSGSADSCRQEVGDFLFSAVNVARHLKAEPEQALTVSCNKFIARFAAAEELAQKQGQRLDALSPEELDRLWNEVKQDSDSRLENQIEK